MDRRKNTERNRIRKRKTGLRHKTKKEKGEDGEKRRKSNDPMSDLDLSSVESRHKISRPSQDRKNCERKKENA